MIAAINKNTVIYTSDLLVMASNAASEIDDIKPETTVFKDAGKSFVSLVDIDVDFYRRKNKSKYVRRNITLPEWLDDMATNEKINVSAVTQKALIQYLGLV